MNLEDMLQVKSITCLNCVSCYSPIKNVYIGDLLSMVIAKAPSECLWITVQNHMNVIAVAKMAKISCVLFVEGVLPSDEMVAKASEAGVVLMSSPKSAYDIAQALSLLQHSQDAK